MQSLYRVEPRSLSGRQETEQDAYSGRYSEREHNGSKAGCNSERIAYSGARDLSGHRRHTVSKEYAERSAEGRCDRSLDYELF